MLKLELDWAGDELPEMGEQLADDGERTGVRVELARERGPASWPLIAVYAVQEPGEEPYRAAMRLVEWLKDVYLVGLGEDEAHEEADELAAGAWEV